MGVSPVGASRHLRLETEPTHWWEVGAVTAAPPACSLLSICWTNQQNVGQLYFSILIILFSLLDHFQCSFFHISIKKCNQKAKETCVFLRIINST